MRFRIHNDRIPCKPKQIRICLGIVRDPPNIQRGDATSFFIPGIRPDNGYGNSISIRLAKLQTIRSGKRQYAAGNLLELESF